MFAISGKGTATHEEQPSATDAKNSGMAQNIVKLIPGVSNALKIITHRSATRRRMTSPSAQTAREIIQLITAAVQHI